MPAGAIEESSLKNLLVEAETLMALDDAASRIVPTSPNFAEIDRVVAKAMVTLRSRLLRVKFVDAATELKRRASFVSDLRMDGEDLFRKTFGCAAPAQLAVDRRPYSLQFEMGDEDYMDLCVKLGMRTSYQDTDGLCFGSGMTRGPIARGLNGGVVMIKARPYVPSGAPAHKTDSPGYGGEAFARGGLKPEKLPAVYRNTPNPLLKRHEEVHTFQGILETVGYPQVNEWMEQDLIDEETAERVAAVNNKSPEEWVPMLHTSLYCENDVMWGDFPALARRVYETDQTRAEAVIRQRALNQDALGVFYRIADARLQQLSGWVVYAVNFFALPPTLAAVKSEYGPQKTVKRHF